MRAHETLEAAVEAAGLPRPQAAVRRPRRSPLATARPVAARAPRPSRCGQTAASSSARRSSTRAPAPTPRCARSSPRSCRCRWSASARHLEHGRHPLRLRHRRQLGRRALTPSWPTKRRRRPNARLLKLAATQLGWPETTLSFAGDEIRRTDREAAIAGRTCWPAPAKRSPGGPTSRQHGRAHITSFAAQVAEVAVDPETGRSRSYASPLRMMSGRSSTRSATRARSTVASCRASATP